MSFWAIFLSEIFSIVYALLSKENNSYGTILSFSYVPYLNCKRDTATLFLRHEISRFSKHPTIFISYLCAYSIYLFPLASHLTKLNIQLVVF